jgi:hypothetical protein
MLNETDKDVTIQNGDGLSLLPGMPGLTLDFRRGDGSRRNLCALVGPNVSSDAVLIRKGLRTKIGSFSYAYLAHLYCLAPGKYDLKVSLLLPQSGTEEQHAISSNNLLLAIPSP